MSDMNSVTANGTTPEAAGQPLPASLGHFGRLAAAVAADEQQQRNAADPLPEKELPGGDSPEPLRVRSPASLKEPPPPPAAAEQQRFSHEPWNWKLGEREQADDAEAVASCDQQQLGVASCDQVEEEGKREGDKLEHRGPQEQNMSESLVA